MRLPWPPTPHEEALETANEHIRSFIDESIPEAGAPVRYGPRE
jgi:hypothetical protein